MPRDTHNVTTMWVEHTEYRIAEAPRPQKTTEWSEDDVWAVLGGVAIVLALVLGALWWIISTVGWAVFIVGLIVIGAVIAGLSGWFGES